MLKELCKRIQHCCATLRRSRNKRNVGSCWLKSLTGFKLCSTTRNNIQQHATGCANRRNMWHPTMLGVAGEQSCVRLQGAWESTLIECTLKSKLSLTNASAMIAAMREEHFALPLFSPDIFNIASAVCFLQEKYVSIGIYKPTKNSLPLFKSANPTNICRQKIELVIMPHSARISRT